MNDEPIDANLTIHSEIAARLPMVGEKRLAVRVRQPAVRALRRGHPWLYDESITSVSHDGEPGDLAVVFDKDRSFVAIGLWDPVSPLRVRVVQGRTPATIDAGFWAARIDQALDLRAGLVGSASSTGWRVINGEGDGFGGLVIDRYGSVAVVKVYSEAWFAHLVAIVGALGAGLVERNDPIETVVLRLSRNITDAAAAIELFDGMTLAGPDPERPSMFTESELAYEVDVVEGQKTGWFLDQRDNRRRVRDLSSGARVLDVFSCGGGFSVSAAAGGAASVHSVDLSRSAIEASRTNMDTNRAALGFDAAHETTVGDAFEVLSDLGDRGAQHDLVVIDPPSFASRKRDVDKAIAGYRRLAMLGANVTAPDGTYVQASCSSRIDEATFVAAVESGLAARGRRLVDVEVTGHGIDHPIAVDEGRYLKAIFGRLVSVSD